jgi:hypothetical protein
VRLALLLLQNYFVLVQKYKYWRKRRCWGCVCPQARPGLLFWKHAGVFYYWYADVCWRVAGRVCPRARRALSWLWAPQLCLARYMCIYTYIYKYIYIYKAACSLLTMSPPTPSRSVHVYIYTYIYSYIYIHIYMYAYLYIYIQIYIHIIYIYIHIYYIYIYYIYIYVYIHGPWTSCLILKASCTSSWRPHTLVA